MQKLFFTAPKHKW